MTPEEKLWEQILIKNGKGELTSFEKHTLCEALSCMDKKGMITLKFGIYLFLLTTNKHHKLI